MRIFLIAAFACATSHAACEAPLGLLGGSKSEKQPAIQWKPVDGASAYRMKLLSRVPNGKIIGSYDTVVAAPPFLPPQPLAEHGAKVTVRLSAICGAQTSAESVATFTIDTSPACVVRALDAVARKDAAELSWPAVKGAASYEVRLFSLDGSFVSSQETQAVTARVELKQPGAVASVRPACGSGLGEAVYRIVTSE